VLALTRVLAALGAIIAAAVLPMAALPRPARARALGGVAGAYGAAAALLLGQQVAVWGTALGAALAAAAAACAGAFAVAAAAERRRAFAHG
jgi:hypothetical protein